MSVLTHTTRERSSIQGLWCIVYRLKTKFTHRGPNVHRAAPMAAPRCPDGSAGLPRILWQGCPQGSPESRRGSPDGSAALPARQPRMAARLLPSLTYEEVGCRAPGPRAARSASTCAANALQQAQRSIVAPATELCDGRTRARELAYAYSSRKIKRKIRVRESLSF